MVAFQYALDICGVSEEDAATLLHVEYAQIVSWVTGEQNPPRPVWFELALLLAMGERHRGRRFKVDPEIEPLLIFVVPLGYAPSKPMRSS